MWKEVLRQRCPWLLTKWLSDPIKDPAVSCSDIFDVLVFPAAPSPHGCTMVATILHITQRSHLSSCAFYVCIFFPHWGRAFSKAFLLRSSWLERWHHSTLLTTDGKRATVFYNTKPVTHSPPSLSDRGKMTPPSLNFFFNMWNENTLG